MSSYHDALGIALPASRREGPGSIRRKNEDEMGKKITKERNKHGEIVKGGKVGKGGGFWMEGF
jgi:hypothetical protein